MVVSSGTAIVKEALQKIIITDMIKEQAFQFVVMLGCGMVIASLYHLFDKYLKKSIKGKITGAIYELIFWIFAAVLTCHFLYYCAYGALKIHTICAFICGAFLWKLLFCVRITVGD